MTLDLAALLDAPVYATFGVEAEITPAGLPPLPKIPVLFRAQEVDEEGASGGVVSTIRPVATLKLADLGGLPRAALAKAEVLIGGIRYVVHATAPAASLRELRLILIEVE